jgi:predicted dehydrogenase
MSMRFTRREIFRKTAALAGAAAASRLWSGPAILASRSPNSKLGTVVIGCGGRGASSHLPEAAKERLVAVVDVDDGKCAKSLKFVADNAAKFKIENFDPSGVKTYFDYRKMFDEMPKDIDAVFVATPNHHHALPAMIAMTLGKGVYVEKPMCHSVEEARRMTEMSKKYKVPTQMGNQGHCGEGYRRLCEYIWAGAIGKITEVHCWSDRANGGVGPRPPTLPAPAGMHWQEWIGPSAYRDFHKDLHPHEWHGWYDFGNGSLGNMACHVMDGAVWALKLKWPTAIEAEQVLGGTDERYPTGDRLRYDFPARGDLPAVKVYWWDGKRPGAKDAGGAGADAPPPGETLPPGSTPEKTISKSAQNRPTMVADLEKKHNRNLGGNGTIYIGEKGIMYSGTYGDGVSFLPAELKDKVPVPDKTIPRVKGSFQEFMDACRAGKPTTCSDFEVASVLTEVVLLGNLAQKAGVGKKVEWDGPNMKCTNLPELNKLVKLEYRKGWTV